MRRITIQCWMGLLVVIVLTFCPLTSFAEAISPVSTYVVPGLEEFNWMHPLIDAHKEYRGFIGHPGGQTAYIFDPVGHVVDSIIFADSVESVKGYWSEEHNGPVMFAVRYNSAQKLWDVSYTRGYPDITIYTATPVGDDYIIDSATHIVCLGDFVFADARELTSLSVGLDIIYDKTGVPNKLAVRAGMRWFEWANTHGTWYYPEFSYGIVSLDLKEEISVDCASTLAIANLDGDTTLDRAVANNYRIDHSDDPWNSYYVYGTWNSINLGNGVSSRKHTNQGSSFFWISGDFVPEKQYDEVIYYGSAYDLLGLHGDPTLHIACYSLRDTAIIEEWYVEDEIRLHYLWYSENKIISYSRQQFVKQLDLAVGIWLDSTQLDRNIAYPTFFGIGTPEILSVLGRIHDTLFVYQLNILTDVEETQDHLLPSSMKLYPNYPNPFNGTTTIRFDNLINQHLSLSIYNILGQTVTVLLDQYMDVGSHTIQWGGLDRKGHPVASGIYFVKLSSAAETKTIRVNYIK